MKNQKGQAALIVVIIIIILIGAWYFLIYNKGAASIYPTTTTPTPMPAGYQNGGDLDTASSQLDSTNLNQMDTGINQVAADSSSF